MKHRDISTLNLSSRLSGCPVPASDRKDVHFSQCDIPFVGIFRPFLGRSRELFDLAQNRMVGTW